MCNLCMSYLIFFFFSSRRRHTRCSRDWSSDVCSSDLKRQIHVTFQEDHVAISLIPFFGDGHLLWASDYPHPDSVWPHSREAIERQMRHLPPEMRRKLTHDNAAVLYGLGGA